MAKPMNVPEIRREMHLAYANLTPQELEAGHWPEIKLLLEGWDIDRGVIGQVVIEKEKAWNRIDRCRQQLEQAREANALLVEELTVTRGRTSRLVPTCKPDDLHSLPVPDSEAGISHLIECEHGRIFLWEHETWKPMPVRGEPGWKPVAWVET